MARRNATARLEARRARLERHAVETDPDVVLNAAARFLELRSRSVDEVRRHLSRAAFPDALVERAIGRLLELGMLDDRAFGLAWVESRDRARPRGEAALRRELSLKGLDRETVAAVLAERDDSARNVSGADETAPTGKQDRASANDGAGAGADERAAERLLAKSRATLL